jgi:hypothetical protein
LGCGQTRFPVRETLVAEAFAAVGLLLSALLGLARPQQ